MLNRSRSVLLVAVLSVGCATSRDASTQARAATAASQPASQIDPVIALIRDEGLEHSQVLETLDYLSNVIGPRLTASEGQRRASEWTRDRLAGWGLDNAHLEPWGPFGRGWDVDRFSFRVTAPTYFTAIGYPRAWSPGFDKPLSSDVVFLDATDESDFADYEGELAGKIVLIGKPRTIDARFEALGKRLTDDELKKLADYKPGEEKIPDKQAADTASERRARFGANDRRSEKLLSGARPTTKVQPLALKRPMNRASTNPSTRATSRSTARSTTRRASTRDAAAKATTSSPATTQAYPRNYDPFVAKMLSFAADEHAALIVTGGTQGDGGTFFVQAAQIPGDPPRPWETNRPRVWAAEGLPTIPPQVALASEDYNRLARAARLGAKVSADVDLVTHFSEKTVSPTNTVAEIKGSDLADQVVMVGAHLDSWHSGTGATDNGVGSACAMEAIRILKALDLHPRRTIRVVLWTGEEQGLFGSDAYVKKHFGYMYEDDTTTSKATTFASTTSPSTSRPAKYLVKAADFEKVSVYFNLDNGTGKIRGIYTQGNLAARPIFQSWLEPFADLDAKTVSLQDTGGTDHLSFDEIGLPGFQFIQDPIEYSTRTHHSNMDVYDRIQPNDAKQASTIMAAFLWNAANMDERFPRKPEPMTK